MEVEVGVGLGGGSNLLGNVPLGVLWSPWEPVVPLTAAAACGPASRERSRCSAERGPPVQPSPPYPGPPDGMNARQVTPEQVHDNKRLETTAAMLLLSGVVVVCSRFRVRAAVC